MEFLDLGLGREQVDYQAIAKTGAPEQEPSPAKGKRWGLAHWLVPSPRRSIRLHYASIFSRRIQDGDSFVSLGGDSLTFVEAAMGVEETLGHLPEGWQEMSVAQLERIAPQRSIWRPISASGEQT